MTSQHSNGIVLPNTYYVIPLLGDSSGKYLNCAYYNSKWAPVSPDSLYYYLQGPNSTSVRIVQPTYQEMLERLIYPPAVDRDATLYAAVAQTRIGENSMPSLFKAETRSVIIPTLFNHARAVILIFTKQTAGGATLIATNDPEIKPGADGGGP